MKARFYGLGEFIFILTSYRVCNIRGHYGSGKTLLSVALAFELWRQGLVDSIYSNFPMAGRSTDYSYGYRFAMLLDEAHIMLDARSFSKQASQTWLKDLRKRESVLILPAVLSVDVRFRSVIVQRIFAFPGNLLWIYRWQIDDGAGKHTGSFQLFYPSYYFNSYSTKYSPNDEDFENIKRVMAGTDYEREAQRNQQEQEGAYLPVQEISYPVEEYPPLAKQVPNPKFSIFSKS